MAADHGYVSLVALRVTDPATYARYRAAMTPILHSYGGDFGCDFIVAEALRGVDDPHVNRVFTIGFPDQATKERFFADERYLAVRAELFAPAVASTQILAELAPIQNT
jgi:uncharacterized protein (DUF1330 family)